MHVEGEGSKLVGSFLLGGDLGELLRRETLSEEFFGSLGGEHVEEDGSAFGDESHSEGGETELDDGSVVEDLGSLVGVLDGSLEVRHEEHVSSVVVSSVESVVVDVGEHGSSSDERVGGSVEVDAEGVDESGRGSSGGSDGGGDGGGLLEVEDDGVGLEEAATERKVSKEVEIASRGKEDTNLRVDVLQTTKNDSSDFLVLLVLLEPLLGLSKNGVENRLVLQTLDVLHSVGVDPLERLGELRKRTRKRKDAKEGKSQLSSRLSTRTSPQLPLPTKKEEEKVNSPPHPTSQPTQSNFP